MRVRIIACLLLAAVLRSNVHAQRTLVTGEECQFPFQFNGEEYNDCLPFGGQSWCQSVTGFFGICAEATGAAPPPPAPAATPQAASTPTPAPAEDPAFPSDATGATTESTSSDWTATEEPATPPPTPPEVSTTATEPEEAASTQLPAETGPDGASNDLPKPADSVAPPPAGSTCCDLLNGIGFSSELPVIILDSKSNAIPDEPKIDGIMCTCGAPGGDIQQPMGIEIRGSTSARDFSKKSFALETRNQEGKDEDVSLLGLDPDSDWVLYGPEMDKTVGLRNYLAMNLFKATGRYVTPTVYCEVFLIQDGGELDMDHYNGVYILMDKVKRDKHRVPVQKMSDDDMSGGYVLKYDNDNFDAGDRILTSDASGLKFIMTYPRKDAATEEHLQWLGRYISEFEDGLATGLRENWESFIDEGSFIDIFLLTELAKNPDGYRGSFYFHKEKGGVLAAGPPWDYNEAFGMCCGYPIEGYLDEGESAGLSGGSAISPEGWRFNICSDKERCQVDPIDGVSRWFRILMSDPSFRSQVASRWATLRSAAWSNAAVDNLVGALVPRIQAAVLRNHDRWAEEIGGGTRDENLAAWTDEMNQVTAWTKSHMDWMDARLIGTPASQPPAAPEPAGAPTG